MEDKTKYEVYRGTPNKTAIWLGSIFGLQRAKDIAIRMAGRIPDYYFVVESATNEIAASINTDEGSPIRSSNVKDVERKAS